MVKKKPKRMCVSCRRMIEKKELLRIVVSAQEPARLDESGKTPGRGAYVCRKKQCLQEALRERKLERGLKAKLSEEATEDLTAILEHLPDDQR